MRTPVILSAALLAAAPAFAQLSPSPPAPVQRVVPNPETVRAAAASRQETARGAATALSLLQQADRELASGRLVAGREAIEQAETRALTRTVLASRAGSPASDPVLTETSAARAAIAARDVPQARSRVAAAIRLIEAGVEPAARDTPGAAPPSPGSEMPPPLPPTARPLD